MSTYIGSELEIFQHALNWKQYFSNTISKHISGQVLEVGAGIGGTTKYLCKGTEAKWVCLEPDLTLVNSIVDKIKLGELPGNCSVICGTLDSLNLNMQFDTVLYIDVLEHIHDDGNEVKHVLKYLKPGGKLIVLVPAFNFLFNSFDRSIGHHRRYDKNMINEITKVDFTRIELKYMDSMGFLASYFNKLFLKQSMPKLSQVKFWDRCLIPISRLLDVFFDFSFGKSLIGIWIRN